MSPLSSQRAGSRADREREICRVSDLYLVSCISAHRFCERTAPIWSLIELNVVIGVGLQYCSLFLCLRGRCFFPLSLSPGRRLLYMEIGCGTTEFIRRRKLKVLRMSHSFLLKLFSMLVLQFLNNALNVCCSVWCVWEQNSCNETLVVCGRGF